MQYLSAALLALLPLAAAAPVATADACNFPLDVEWTLHDLYYHSSIVFSTPAHQIPSGFISFNLTNTATSYTVPCSAYSTRLSNFFYADQWYSCDTSSAPTGAQVSFRFDQPTGRVDLNQTWSCTVGTDVATIRASGNGTAALQCTNTEYHNPNWTTPGDIYQSYNTDCEKTDLSFKPYQISAVL